MILDGSCHCGDTRVRLTLSGCPVDAEVRACGCSFCRRHGARTVTDREGRVDIAAGQGLTRYRFGAKTADFLVCSRCGTYLAAVIETTEGPRATLNVNALDARSAFDPMPPTVDYSEESREARIRRRSVRWTPAVMRERVAENGA